MRDLLANERCSWAVLDLLSSTDVGRWVQTEAEDDMVSAVSDLEVREWLEQREVEGEEQAAAGGTGAGEEMPLFLPMPSFRASADDE